MDQEKGETAGETDSKLLAFHEMGLDDRILQAISALGWATPTLIQEKAVPLALEGKDIMARARTGSGKTAAYVIPLVQKILHLKQTATEQCVKALVMTPTKELCNQAFRNIQEMTSYCSREVRCVDISGQARLDAQKPLLADNPDIVVGTPSRVLAHIVAKNLNVKQSVEMVVIDEADLVFSFGYEDEIKELLGHLPSIYQAFLMSATLSEDVRSLKKMILHNPVILKLEESQLPENSQLTQYHIKCEEADKFVLIYTLLKLRLIRGKSIIFVNSIDRCYRLKLYLEQFGIHSCVLNSELPVNSRCHIVNQFNENLYDIIIAADELSLDKPMEDTGKKKNKGNKKPKKKDKESGISRGIDFQFISNVINFDFPPDVDSYIHRVGRTARGDNDGTALSFVRSKELMLLEAVEQTLAETHPDGESVFKPYQFKMDEIEGFRYRAMDAMRAVTSIAVKEARIKEIRSEVLNSKKLKSYFEDNPRDLEVLRHDKKIRNVKLPAHLKDVPDYIVPKTLRGSRPESSSSQSHYQYKPGGRGRRNPQKRRADPLKSFKFSGFSKKRRKE